MKKFLIICCTAFAIAACNNSGSGAITEDTLGDNDSSMPRNGGTGPGNTMTDTGSIFNDTSKNRLQDTNSYDNMSNRINPDSSR